jgi:hypothetical protein
MNDDHLENNLGKICFWWPEDRYYQDYGNKTDGNVFAKVNYQIAKKLVFLEIYNIEMWIIKLMEFRQKW